MAAMTIQQMRDKIAQLNKDIEENILALDVLAARDSLRERDWLLRRLQRTLKREEKQAENA